MLSVPFTEIGFLKNKSTDSGNFTRQKLSWVAYIGGNVNREDFWAMLSLRNKIF